jgi:hypothetical protein
VRDVLPVQLLQHRAGIEDHELAGDLSIDEHGVVGRVCWRPRAAGILRWGTWPAPCRKTSRSLAADAPRMKTGARRRSTALKRKPSIWRRAARDGNGPPSHIGRHGANDCDVTTADLREQTPSASVVAEAAIASAKFGPPRPARSRAVTSGRNCRIACLVARAADALAT